MTPSLTHWRQPLNQLFVHQKCNVTTNWLSLGKTLGLNLSLQCVRGGRWQAVWPPVRAHTNGCRTCVEAVPRSPTSSILAAAWVRFTWRSGHIQQIMTRGCHPPGTPHTTLGVPPFLMIQDNDTCGTKPAWNKNKRTKCCFITKYHRLSPCVFSSSAPGWWRQTHSKDKAPLED